MKNTLTTIEDRHALKVDVRGPGECWPWLGAKTKGYGVLGKGRRGEGLEQAHRVAYERAKGPIPAGFVVDHECHNRDSGCPGGTPCPHRACQNPDHLLTRTRGGNVLSSDRTLTGKQVRMTHCSSDHEFTEENTYVYRGMRYCRECRRARSKKYYQDRKKV